MKCELCGSKKNVRKFYGFMHNKFYTECRKCFEKAMDYAAKMQGTTYTKEEIETEWNSGTE